MKVVAEVEFTIRTSSERTGFGTGGRYSDATADAVAQAMELLKSVQGATVIAVTAKRQ